MLSDRQRSDTSQAPDLTSTNSSSPRTSSHFSLFSLQGGGIYVGGGGTNTLDLYSTSFVGNSAGDTGGDIHDDGSGNTVTVHATCAPGSSGAATPGASLFTDGTITGDGESLVVEASSSSR